MCVRVSIYIYICICLNADFNLHGCFQLKNEGMEGSLKKGALGAFQSLLYVCVCIYRCLNADFILHGHFQLNFHR